MYGALNFIKVDHRHPMFNGRFTQMVSHLAQYDHGLPFGVQNLSAQIPDDVE